MSAVGRRSRVATSLLALLVPCSCDAPQRPEILRRWGEQVTTIEVRVEPRLYERMGEARWQSLAEEWQVDGAPQLAFKSGTARVLREDSVSFIGLTAAQRTCEARGGVSAREGCLAAGQCGVTQRFERVVQCGREILEADVALNQDLFDASSDEVFLTIVHELGHVFGLPHPHAEQTHSSVMFPDGRAARRPTTWDRRLLELVYGSSCFDD